MSKNLKGEHTIAKGNIKNAPNESRASEIPLNRLPLS